MSLSGHSMGILIGGIVPAFIFGFSNVFVKAATERGIAPGMYLLCVSGAALCAGLITIVWLGDRTVSWSAGSMAFLAGFCWCFGIVGVAYALNHYGTPISQLTPLFNMNTLVAVVLGLLVFAEWQQVKVVPLMLGSVLMIVGAVLVAKA